MATLSAHGAFNVRDFGAKGDGVTDDTAAFQAAIDAVAAQGAGKVVVPYSPKGYRIAAPGREFVEGRPCRGQLVIPPIRGLNIAFEGEMPCKLLYSYQVRPPEAVKNNFSPTRFGRMKIANTCIFSDWTPPDERDPKARPWTILATVQGNSCNGRFSVSQVSIANLEFRAHLDKDVMYPRGGCVNLQNSSRAIVRDSQFCLDDNVGDTVLGKSLQPNPCHTVGLMMSGDQNDNQVLNNVSVQGFRYGLVLGEHVVADYLYVHNCEEGIVFHDATHLSVINHVVAQHNRVILSSAPDGLFGHRAAPCNVIVGSVNFESGHGTLPVVSRLVYGVSDPGNRLCGSLVWHQPWGDGKFPVNGAKNFRIVRFPETPH
ncbi:MAG: hypothetical protein IKZ22_08570 [Kiritimatiellae bacterium]|nr:hypothetical protein [Kiritimatiellia bacterium]